MERATFQIQMKVLEEKWSGAYTKTAVDLIWHKVKGLPDWTMEKIVNRFLLNLRSYPLEKEWDTVVNKILENERLSSEQDRMPSYDMAKDLECKANTDFARACVEALKEYTSGKIDEATFHRRCDEMDEVAVQLMRQSGMATCSDCGRSGYNFKKGYLARCHCLFGAQKREVLEWKDRSIKIPLVKPPLRVQ